MLKVFMKTRLYNAQDTSSLLGYSESENYIQANVETGKAALFTWAIIGNRYSDSAFKYRTLVESSPHRPPVF